MEWREKSHFSLGLWETTWDERGSPRNGAHVLVDKSIAPTAELAEQIARQIIYNYPLPSSHTKKDTCIFESISPYVSGQILVTFVQTEKNDPGTFTLEKSREKIHEMLTGVAH